MSDTIPGPGNCIFQFYDDWTGGRAYTLELHGYRFRIGIFRGQGEVFEWRCNPHADDTERLSRAAYGDLWCDRAAPGWAGEVRGTLNAALAEARRVADRALRTLPPPTSM